MSDCDICPGCGSPLPSDAPKGLCPRCLFRLGFEPDFVCSDVSETQPAEVSSEAAAIASEPKLGTFGDYDLIEVIAEGGMGVVYKARQRGLNRLVAVKMIRRAHLARPRDIERFHREASAAARLQHPRIVAIHETGEIGGQHFYSMDYVPGCTLAALVREHPLSPRSAAAILKTVAEAIHYAHEHGVLHRDLKPSNILIDRQNQPNVTDFGLAKLLEESTDMTLSGQVFGSPSYMAPEQAAGRSHAADVRADVYALGAILYEMVSGRPPFKADTSFETLKLVVTTEPVPLRLLNPGLPRDIETICLKCLEKEPARRYQTAQMLADDLCRFLEGKPVHARPLGWFGKICRWARRNPRLAGMTMNELGRGIRAWFGWRVLAMGKSRGGSPRGSAEPLAFIFGPSQSQPVERSRRPAI